MKKTYLNLHKYFLIIFLCMPYFIQSAQNGIRPSSADRQFAAETESKNRRAAQQEQEESKALAAMETQADTKLDREVKIEEDAKQNAQDLEDACAILFKLKGKDVDHYGTGEGLPKVLQNLVFDKLQEIQHKKTLLERGKNNDLHDWLNFDYKVDSHGKRYVIAHSTEWNRLKIWDAETEKVITELPIESGESEENSVACHIDDQNDLHVVSAASKQNIRIWNVTKGNKLRTIAYAGEKQIISHADSQGNWQIITASLKDDTIKMWDGVTGNLLYTIADEKFARNGKLIVHTDTQGNKYLIKADQNIKIWDYKTGRLLNSLILDEDEYCYALTTYTDQNGEWYIIGGVDGVETCIKVWHGKSGEIIHKINDLQTIYNIGTVTDKRQGWFIVAHDEDGKICVVDGVSGNIIHRLSHGDGVVVVDIKIYNTADNWFIVSATNDPGEENTTVSICIWNGTTGKCVQKLRNCQESNFINLALDYDGRGNLRKIISHTQEAIKFWGFGLGEFEQALNDVRQNNAQKSSSSHSHEHLTNPQHGVKRKNDTVDNADNAKRAKKDNLNSSSSSSNSNGSSGMDTSK